LHHILHIYYHHSITHLTSRLPSLLLTPPSHPPISPLSLHDALPISNRAASASWSSRRCARTPRRATWRSACRSRVVGFSRTSSKDRKSTRLNSSHLGISYAVFCLKKKKKKEINTICKSIIIILPAST